MIKRMNSTTINAKLLCISYNTSLCVTVLSYVEIQESGGDVPIFVKIGAGAVATGVRWCHSHRTEIVELPIFIHCVFIQSYIKF